MCVCVFVSGLGVFVGGGGGCHLSDRRSEVLCFIVALEAGNLQQQQQPHEAQRRR